MDAKLQAQLDNMTAPPSTNHCFSVHKCCWVELPDSNFLDIDFHLPPLKHTEKGYKSDTIVVLTSRGTVYGRVIEACGGFVSVSKDTSETNYQDSLKWHSEDGEEVVGWLPVPVFHVTDTKTLYQDTSKNSGFSFSYAE